MKTTLIMMFVAVAGVASYVANKTVAVDEVDVKDQQLYACVIYPMCTIPDLYSQKDTKDSKAKDTSNDKLKLA